MSGTHFDNDGNGFANDIAGWNFFDNNNEPADLSSYFAAYHHGTDRALDAAERGNDGEGSIGVCPHCQIMPVRTWDTFVSDANDFALGMMYATDNGAKVLEGANGSLYHSAFAEAASQYAYEHGVVQTFSGDDLNTADHNYPADYGHAMLIQGSVNDTEGLGQESSQWLEAEKLCGVAGEPQCLGSNLPVSTFLRGANTTQYGGKSSITMQGPTGSVNTSKASGAAALVVSAGLDHGIALRPDETRELLEQTAERVLNGNTAGAGVADPGANPALPSDEQWTPHFGWGRANVGAAVGAVQAGNIPPEAAIDSPNWYAPLTGSSVSIAGLARARFATGGRFHWKLEWGAGQAPSAWTTAGEGDSIGHRHELRLDRPAGGSRSAGHLRRAAGSRRPHLRACRAEPVPARIHGAARGQRRRHTAERHRQARVQHVHRPDSDARLPEVDGCRRRIGDALRGPHRQQPPTADSPDRGRNGQRLRSERRRAEGLAGAHRSPAVGARTQRLARPCSARVAARASSCCGRSTTSRTMGRRT